jgi:hypothetical protein
MVGKGGATVGGGGSVAVGCVITRVGVGAIADGSTLGCPASAVGTAAVMADVGITSTGESSLPQAARTKTKARRTIIPIFRPVNLSIFINISIMGPAGPWGDEGGWG